MDRHLSKVHGKTPAPHPKPDLSTNRSTSYINDIGKGREEKRGTLSNKVKREK